MITDFFNYATELKDFAPQMPTDTKIENLEAHYRPQYQKIVNLIGVDTYEALKTYYDANRNDVISINGKAVSFLRGALANLTAIPYFIFEASQRNNTANNLYRYQENKQLESYLENAWTELNFLLDHLENNALVTFTDYANTDQFKLRQTLFIKNALEFKKYYGAINSSYFFNNVIYIIEEVQNDEIKSRLEAFPTITDDNMKWLVGKAIAYETLSRACLQLDYTELPQGLRNDLDKEINQKNGKETEIKSALSATFGNKAKEYLLKIEEANNEPRNTTYTMPQNTITESDKYYMP
jgi:hypothetical protein